MREYDDFMNEYSSLHELCPKCGSRSHSTTLVGYILNLDHTEDYKDLNKCICQDCHDVHYTHDRVSVNDIRDRKINIALESNP